MAYFSYSLILAIYTSLNISCNPKPKCRMASLFSGKQSYVNFWEIPGQNKKKMKHNECHNLMFLEILSNVHQRRK